MNAEQKKLIEDNPNLSGEAISRLIGVDKSVVNKFREKPTWKHSGIGIPFVYDSANKDGIYKALIFNGRTLARGKLTHVIENLDRLIFCLENNNGNLPKRLKESIFDDLEFIRRG